MNDDQLLRYYAATCCWTGLGVGRPARPARRARADHRRRWPGLAGGLVSGQCRRRAASPWSTTTAWTSATCSVRLLTTCRAWAQPKAGSVRASIAAINPDVQVNAIVRRADAALLDEMGAAGQRWCSTAATTSPPRHAVNAACVRHGKLLVWGAAIGWDAQLSVVDPKQPGAPCYACLFPPEAPHTDEACATMGVLAPLVGVVGSLTGGRSHQAAGGRGAPRWPVSC